MRTTTTTITVQDTALGSLPTSRYAPRQERAVLALLRSKAPRRALSRADAERIAEWQALALLELAGLRQPPVPSELISELPRVLVRSDVDLPGPAGTVWRDGRWVIVINGSEPYARQRFSLAHEYKHTIDHRYADVMYVDRPGITSKSQAEDAADYFAACLLMPRPWIKAAWGNRVQRLSDLCELFQVSPQAMARRLDHLGLRPLAGGSDQRENRQMPTTVQRAR